MKRSIYLVMKYLQGWVFNVVPWLLAIPAGFIAGWISDAMTAKGLSSIVFRKENVIMNTVHNSHLHQ